MTNVINFRVPGISPSQELTCPQELDYLVQSAPADFEPVKGAGHVQSKYFINYRSDTEADLGMCKERYQIVQNQDLFSSLSLALFKSAPPRALEGAVIKPKTS